MASAPEATTVLSDANFPARWGKTVPDYAFKNRDDVVKVRIPPRFIKIGKKAFYGCSNLEECVVHRGSRSTSTPSRMFKAPGNYGAGELTFRPNGAILSQTKRFGKSRRGEGGASVPD